MAETGSYPSLSSRPASLGSISRNISSRRSSHSPGWHTRTISRCVPSSSKKRRSRPRPASVRTSIGRTKRFLLAEYPMRRPPALTRSRASDSAGVSSRLGAGFAASGFAASGAARSSACGAAEVAGGSAEGSGDCAGSFGPQAASDVSSRATERIGGRVTGRTIVQSGASGVRAEHVEQERAAVLGHGAALERLGTTGICHLKSATL